MSLTRHFCCCLPVRLGVFVLSLLSFIGGVGYAGAVWGAYKQSQEEDHVSLTSKQKIAFILTGVVYLIFALAALMGLIGAITRKRGLVATYNTVAWFRFGAQVAVGAFFIYALYENNHDLVTSCKEKIIEVNNSTKGATGTSTDAENACRAFTKWGRTGAIIVLGVILLIDLYCCFIVSRCVSQLTDEQSFRAGNRNSRVEANASGSSSYYPHESIQSGTELLNKQGQEPGYPYAQSHHAFGQKV